LAAEDNCKPPAVPGCGRCEPLQNVRARSRILSRRGVL